VSPGFRWLNPTRTDELRDLLAVEGVAFGEQGRADRGQRGGLDELASLCGLTESGGMAIGKTFPRGRKLLDARDS
jgi:hypothetical protein